MMDYIFRYVCSFQNDQFTLKPQSYSSQRSKCLIWFNETIYSTINTRYLRTFLGISISKFTVPNCEPQVSFDSFLGNLTTRKITKNVKKGKSVFNSLLSI